MVLYFLRFGKYVGSVFLTQLNIRTWDLWILLVFGLEMTSC